MVKYLKAIPEKVFFANLSFKNDKQPLIISKTCLLKLFSKRPVIGCLADSWNRSALEIFQIFWMWFHMTFIYLLRAASGIFNKTKIKYVWQALFQCEYCFYSTVKYKIEKLMLLPCIVQKN